MSLSEFIKTYFIDPIVYDQGYNIYNTTFYALILILAIWGIYHLLIRMKINIDKKFIVSLLPFIVFGSAFRVWEDAGIVSSKFFVTPGSYLVTASLVLIAIFSGLMIQKKLKIPYYKIVFGIGTVLALVAVSPLRINNWFGLLIIIGIFSVIAIITEFVSRKYSIKPLYKYGFLAHMLDASATFTAIQFFPTRYVEQHVLSGFFIYTFGPWSFFLLKLAVVIPVIYFIAKSKDIDDNWRNLLMFAVITLGLAPGLRDTFMLMMGI